MATQVRADCNAAQNLIHALNLKHYHLLAVHAGLRGFFVQDWRVCHHATTGKILVLQTFSGQARAIPAALSCEVLLGGFKAGQIGDEEERMLSTGVTL
jgi:hypothetical protein